jgi:ferredoxin
MNTCKKVCSESKLQERGEHHRLIIQINDTITQMTGKKCLSCKLCLCMSLCARGTLCPLGLEIVSLDIIATATLLCLIQVEA